MGFLRFEQISLCLVGLTAASIAEGARAVEPMGKPWRCHIIDDSSRGADGVKLADVNGDELPDIATGWEEEGVTRVYLHPGHNAVKQSWPAVTVGKTPAVEDAAFVDLDGDGATDVVSCTEGRERNVFIHWAPQRREDLLDPQAWQQVALTASQDRMQWMFAWPMNVDGVRGVDLVVGGKGRGAALGWFSAPTNPREVSGFQWHPITPVGWLMSIWPRDMDDDGDVDLVISDRYGELRGCRWLENPGRGRRQTQPWNNHWMGAQGLEVLSMDLTDLDGDGMEDAVVAVKDYRLLFLRRADRQGRTWETHEISADFAAGNTRAVAVGDINGDGRPDLVITTWIARGKHGVLWLEYKKQPSDRLWKAHQVSGRERGVKFDRMELIDLDGDGDLDVLTCEEQEGDGGMGVFWYENPR